MAFRGVDPWLLRVLARHLELETAPLLRRGAVIALDTLTDQEMRGVGDVTAFRLASAASWMDEAAFDLRRRAAIVETAEQLDGWARTFPITIERRAVAEAVAVTTGGYTMDPSAEIDRHLAQEADRHARLVTAALQPILESPDPAALAAVTTTVEEMSSEPWFPAAMATVFDTIGPGGAAGIVAQLVSVPVGDYDDEDLTRWAEAFPAATRGGLGWTNDDIVDWFEYGAAGAAQLLRTGDLDRSFLARVVALIGLDPYVHRGPEPVAGVRFLLASGEDLWQHVGPRAADPRAVILNALGDHVDLAIEVLEAPGVVEALVTAPWPLDHGIALGGLLSVVSVQGTMVSPDRAGAIRRRALAAAAAADEVAPGLRPGIADLTTPHLADLAFSLALGSRAEPLASRPGLELPAVDVRRLLRLIAEDDAAFGRLTAGYAAWVATTLGDPTTDYDRHLRAAADEIGALTFALAYTDRQVRIDTQETATAERLSALQALQFLASSGVALLPGFVDTASAFALERIVRMIQAEVGEPPPDLLAEHGRWKEQMLDDLEYLIAIEMVEHGLLDIPIDTTGLSRIEFLYAVEEVDGPLETVMAIIEAQARRQREGIEDGT